MKNSDKTKQLMERVARAGVDLVEAERGLRQARAEIRAMYATYFRAHGRPEGDFNPYNEAFKGVVQFTAAANDRRSGARQKVYNARRRLESAVRALGRAK